MNEVTDKNAAEVAKTVKGGCVIGPSTVRRSPSIAALAMALSKAQSEMKNPPKDSVNPHFKSRYADLATVRDTVMPSLTKHGLSVMQLPCDSDDAPALTTILLHSSGEWVETTMKLRPGKMDPQGIGSALTYARRYALQSICSVAADDDDDGNAGSQPARQTQQAQPPAKPPEQVQTQVVNQFVAQFAKCVTEEQYGAVCSLIRDGINAGAINTATREALGKISQATKERVKTLK